MLVLESDEHIILEVRRHWLIFALQVVGILAFAFIPLIFILVMSTLSMFAEIWKAVSINLIFFIWSLWLVMLWTLLFSTWLHYYLDVWIVTNKRLVDFDFKGLFRYETSSMRLDRLQDITIEVNGLLANIFHFGNLHVETAGETSNPFDITNAANPAKVKKIIFEAYSKSVETHPEHHPAI